MYNELINDERKYASMRLAIISGNTNAIKSQMSSFLSDFKDMNKSTARSLGESWNDLLDLIDEVKSASESVDDIKDSKSESSAKSSKPIVTVKQGSADEKILKSQYGNNLEYSYGDSNQFVGADRYETNDLFQEYLKKYGLKAKDAGDLWQFDSGGYTGDWGDSSGKLALLHQKELILNQQDTPNFLKGLTLVDGMMDKIKI